MWSRHPARSSRPTRKGPVRRTAPSRGPRGLATQDAGQHRHVDIAAREDQAYALAGVSIPFLEEGRQRRGTGAFGKIVRGRVVQANGFGDLVLADLDKARGAACDDAECLRLRIAASEPVGEGPGRTGSHGTPRLERQREGRSVL